MIGVCISEHPILVGSYLWLFHICGNLNIIFHIVFIVGKLRISTSGDASFCQLLANGRRLPMPLMYTPRAANFADPFLQWKCHGSVGKMVFPPVKFPSSFSRSNCCFGVSPTYPTWPDLWISDGHRWLRMYWHPNGHIPTILPKQPAWGQ